ncbi:aromatic di-alanine and TPR containing protein [Ceratobasidium sp. AG-Ba]|nr:aromatic di-alanine and TPR containing protein [Ceratobasidium sp. AG-Ba]
MFTRPTYFVRKYAEGILHSFEMSKDPKDASEAIEYLYPYAFTLPRTADLRDDTSLVASNLLVKIAEQSSHPILLDAYHNLIHRLIMMPWLGLDHWKRLAKIQNLPRYLPTAAALCAIKHGDLPVAVRLLDLSRYLILEHGQRLRPDPGHMDLLVRQLHVGMAGIPPSLIATEAESQKATRCAKENEYAGYAQELYELLHWLRAQPGFEGFMLPSSDNDAMRLVNVGPVVILLPGQDVCFAILITKSENNGFSMQNLSLSQLSEDSARAMSDRHGRGTFSDDVDENLRHFVGGSRAQRRSAESIMQQILS